MAKVRVHEIAKELGKSSKEIVEILQKLGLDVKNHMSTIEDSQANWVRKQLTAKDKDSQRPSEPAVPLKLKARPTDKAPANTGSPRPQRPAPQRNLLPARSQRAKPARPAQTTNRSQRCATPRRAAAAAQSKGPAALRAGHASGQPEAANRDAVSSPERADRPAPTCATDEGQRQPGPCS